MKEEEKTLSEKIDDIFDKGLDWTNHSDRHREMIKSIFADAVRRLKEEIVNTNFEAYKKGWLIDKINSIMGDFEDNHSQRESSRVANVVANEVSPKGETELSSHPADNTLGCGKLPNIKDYPNEDPDDFCSKCGTILIYSNLRFYCPSCQKSDVCEVESGVKGYGYDDKKFKKKSESEVKR